jgi:hypothetical protein
MGLRNRALGLRQQMKYIVTGSRYADCHCYPTAGYIVTTTQRLNENLVTDFISLETNAANPSLYRQR